IMLQQTTLATVLGQRRFEKFLAQYPDLESIAAAPESELLRAWEGLGYYNRVRNLQKTARSVLADHDGRFPESAAELQKLPGLGPYTAGAVASFAFRQAAPIVDGNIARVLSRLYNDPTPIDSTPGQKLLWQRAAALLNAAQIHHHNAALMELGQVLCSPKNPACDRCPVARHCRAKDPAALPRKKPRRQSIAVEEHALLVLKDQHILLAESPNERRRGLHHLPLREVGELAHLRPLTETHRYVITHHRVTLTLYPCPPSQIPHGLQVGERYYPLSQLPDLPLPSPLRRALEAVLGE
ncbi:MAG: A/G-specific adenine glycosylase, partial [Verrucomicrobiales bacterium]